jgi:hypothetical protein
LGEKMKEPLRTPSTRLGGLHSASPINRCVVGIRPKSHAYRLLRGVDHVNALDLRVPE